MVDGSNDAPWVALAVFTQPHGVSGRIKVKSFTEPADDFAQHAPLTYESGAPLKLKVTGHTQGLTIVEIEGVTRREQAELLRGKKIGIPRVAMPVLKQPNQYYTDDLIGMAVVDQAGESFGTVQTIANYGASDILEILRLSGARELYAFTLANFPEIDLVARRIIIHPPEIFYAEEAQD